MLTNKIALSFQQISEILKRKVNFRMKAFEFHFQTWRNLQEINNAYGVKNPFLESLKRYSIKGAKGAAVVCAVAVAGVAVWQGIKFLPKPGPEAAIHSEKKENSEIIPVVNETKSQVIPDLPATDTLVKANIIEQTPPEPVPAVESPGKDYYVLFANKAYRKMYLLTKIGSKWNILKTYSINLGGQKGQKITAGDRRTPEGLYFIVGRREQSELARIYGPLAYMTNYPNKQDIEAGRSGQGIWVHGTESDSAPLETKGCISLANNDILELSTFLRFGICTPILIMNDSSNTDPLKSPDLKRIENEYKGVWNHYTESNSKLIDFLENWRRAWISREIDAYAKYYDQRKFQGDGGGWSQWRERKIRTFKIYSSIQVDIENITITELTDTTATVKFIQRYTSNINSMENGKKLSLITSNGEWKIVRESTFPKEELLL